MFTGFSTPPAFPRTPFQSFHYYAHSLNRQYAILNSVSDKGGRKNASFPEIFLVIALAALNLAYTFHSGKNVLEFCPEKAGTLGYSCRMGMLRGSIVVTEAG